MGGVGKALFGSKAKSKSRQLPNMTPEQLQALNSVLAGFTPNIQDFTSAPTKYTGDFTAPLNNLQKLSLSSLENLSKEMGSSATYQQGNESLIKMMQTGGKQDITSVFENSILNPMLKQFREQTIPSVIGNFGGTGAYGSDRQKQQQIALQNLDDSVLSAGSKLAYDAGDSANKNILQALGLLPAVTNAPVDALSKIFGVGLQEQGVRQTGIGTELDYINSQNAAETAKLQALIAALGLKPNENVVTQSGGSSGIAGSLIGAAATIFSDARLKRNIIRVGTHKRGFGIYRYEIFNHEEYGVLAQEIQHLLPNAVHMHQSGYLMVNYSELNGG